jgi:pyruvate decarboxylase
VVIDGGSGRHHWREQIDPMIAALKIPFFVTCLGKGLADETSPYYRGPIAGMGSPDSVTKALATADVILWLGNYPSDFNT